MFLLTPTMNAKIIPQRMWPTFLAVMKNGRESPDSPPPDCRESLASKTKSQISKVNTPHVMQMSWWFIQDTSNWDVCVVPRRAYYDNQLDNGRPRNSVIINAEVHNKGMWYYLTKVEKEYEWILAHRSQHCNVIVQCIWLTQDITSMAMSLSSSIEHLFVM